ncbi:MAG: SDR family oxidoreductase [Geminicoccaceae bacterium]
MDLGLGGRRAIVCAASKGLGRGCATALAREGVALLICARGAEALESTAAAIRSETGAAVRTVACDIATEEGRRAVLDACPSPDILINNAGGPPPGDFADFDLDDWRRAIEANMLTPLALIRTVVPGMVERGFGRIVNITSSSVKAPIPSLELSNGARAGLTGAVAALARKTVRHNVTINNLLPGSFDTDRLRGGMTKAATAAGQSLDAYMTEAAARTPAGRFGTAEEFGQICAMLCAAQSSYLTGQNILLDGGAYPGLL